MSEQELQAAINSLRTHSVRLNYLTIGITLAVLLVGGWIMHRSLASYGASLAKAEERESRFLAVQKELQQQLIESQKQRLRNDSQIKIIRDVIEVKQQQASAEIAKVTNPSNDETQVVKDSQTYLRVTPTLSGGLFSFTKPDVQGFIETRIQADECQVRAEQQQKQITLQQENIQSLDTDLKKTRETLASAQDAMKAYKQTAKKSKWRRFGDAVLKVSLMAAGVAIGRAL